jgi:hypothetical protein
LTFKAVACKLDASEFESAPVTVNVQNAVSFPRWDVLAGETLATFAAQGPASATTYWLRVYGPKYPKAQTPPLAYYDLDDLGSSQNGAVENTVNWADANFAQGATYYSVIKYAIPGGTEVFTMPPKKTPPGSFPDVGYWVVAYEDSFHRFWMLDPNNVVIPVWVKDPPNPPFGPPASPYYQVALNQWIAFANNAGPHPVFRHGPCYTGFEPQTDDWSA